MPPSKMIPHSLCPALSWLGIALLGITCFFLLSASGNDVTPARTDERGATFIGSPTQGGLLIGQTIPGSRVILDRQILPITPKGRFLIGLPRQAKPGLSLTIRHPDGTQYEESIAVTPRQYAIERIDGLPPATVSPDAATLERIQAEREIILQARQGQDTLPLLLEQDNDPSIMLWPVLGRISGVYGSQRILNGKPRSPHLGIDIAAPQGTPIQAPATGRVNLVDQDMVFTGNTIMLDHGHGLTSVYAHLDEIWVEEGQMIAPGTPLGTIGATGRATGPHLHWGVHWQGIGIDPALLTPAMPTRQEGGNPSRLE